jgi:4-amino-4-deoxy-L-arabinose transferase-like glycosyltransferase
MIGRFSAFQGKMKDFRLMAIFAVSLTIHLAVALCSSGGIVQDDAISYRDLGRNLAHGNGLVFEPGGRPATWRAPGYPLLLGGVFRLTGDSECAARIANAFLWLGTAICAAAIAYRLLEPSAALLACALVAFYPEFLGLTGLLWSESLSIFLFVATLSSLVFLGSNRRWSIAIFAGILCGCCILTRSSFIVLPFVVVLAGFAGLLKRSQAIATAIVSLALVAPWTARNYSLLGHFVLVESNATMNLFAGSRPYAPMPFTFQVLKQLPNDPEFEAINSLPESQRYVAFGKAATQTIRAHPVRFLALSVSKTFDFWLPDFFVARNLASGSYGAGFRWMWPIVMIVTVGAYLIVCAGAIFTAFKLRRNRVVQFAVLLLVAYTLPHSIVYGASRYHLPLMPILCIMAAPALISFRGKSMRQV